MELLEKPQPVMTRHDEIDQDDVGRLHFHGNDGLVGGADVAGLIAPIA